MTNPVLGVLAFAAIPAGAALAGAVAACLRPPSRIASSVCQHVAAGVVFAAVAVELLPVLQEARDPVALTVGFALGVASMLALRVATEGREETGLSLVVGVDFAVDGLLVGIGFAAGEAAGFLVTVALTLEVFFLGLSTVAPQLAAGRSRRRAIATVAVFSAVLLGAAGTGATLLSGLAGRGLAGLTAFGVAALLYLVTEELLVEAHDGGTERPWVASTFFIGFLAILLLDGLSGR